MLDVPTWRENSFPEGQEPAVVQSALKVTVYIEATRASGEIDPYCWEVQAVELKVPLPVLDAQATEPLEPTNAASTGYETRMRPPVVISFNVVNVKRNCAGPPATAPSRLEEMLGIVPCVSPLETATPVVT